MIKLEITRFLCTPALVSGRGWLNFGDEKNICSALYCSNFGQSNQDKACGCGELECSKEW